MALVYTFGYRGRDPQELLMLAKRHKAAVIDVRYSPRSWDRRWGKRALKRLLKKQYIWIKEFGNANRTGEGDAEIVDFDACVKKLQKLCYPSYILLCEEVDPAECHRALIAKRLDEYVLGFDYKGDMGNMSDIKFVDSVVFDYLLALHKRYKERGIRRRFGFTKIISGWCVIPGCERQPYVGIEMYGADKEIRRMVDRAIQRRFAQAYVHVFNRG